VQTRQAYEVLLHLIQQELEDVPHDVLRGAVEEVLTVLKDANLQVAEQKKQMEDLLHLSKPIDEGLFSQLMEVGDLITDLKTEAKSEDLPLVEEPISVVFE